MKIRFLRRTLAFWLVVGLAATAATLLPHAVRLPRPRPPGAGVRVGAGKPAPARNPRCPQESFDMSASGDNLYWL